MNAQPPSEANRPRQLSVIALALAALAAGATNAHASTLVVDRDKAQCPSADFTSIQAAVDAAQPVDLIRVCPDHYGESVVIDKPLTLKGDPEVIEAIDCFQSTPAQPGDLDPTRQAIVDPAGDGFSIALKLNSNNVAVEGLVVEGASVGIDASDRFSGYRIHHNLLRHNTLFGVDFGSEGTRESRVDHNCLRDNGWAVASELDDDSLWKPSSGGSERDAWNARDLTNARIDHNTTSGNTSYGGGALQITGPGQRVRVTIDHNLLRQDLGGILLQNATDSAILDNDIIDGLGNSIVIGGGSERLLIAANRVRNTAFAGILFVDTFLDRFPIPNHDIVVTDNEVTGTAVGIDVKENNLVDSLISENTVSHSGFHGIWLRSGDTGNVVRDNQTNDNYFTGILLNFGTTGNLVRANQADNNGIAGISAILGATGNRFERNSMHGNGWRSDTMLRRADARDLNPLLNGMLQNVWTGNSCDTDIPAGMICGVG
jgi:parallel beta-helix repeat protein